MNTTASRMRAHPFVFFAALLLFLAVQVYLPGPVHGTRYFAMSTTEMTCRADMIAVGILGPREKGRWSAARTFTIEKILKGRGYTAGQAIAIKPHPMVGFHGNAGKVRVVVWLRVTDKEVRPLNYGNSTKSPDEKILQAIERDLKVLASPANHIEKADAQYVEALCYWIMTTWYDAKFSRRNTSVRDEDLVQPWEGKMAQEVTRRQAIDFLIRVVADAKSQHRTLAVQLLTPFRDPRALDALVAALKDKRELCRVYAAKGLGLLGDKRAVRPLLQTLKPLRERDYGIRAGIVAALGNIGDRSALPALIRELKAGDHEEAGKALAKIQDPRVLPVLLEVLWNEDQSWGSLSDTVLRIKHPSILKQARKRMYDHPEAPYILAQLGDPKAKSFMLKLIRQCNPTGAIWAVRTKDPQAVESMIKSMEQLGNSRFPWTAKDVFALIERRRAIQIASRLLTERRSDLAFVEILNRSLGISKDPHAGTMGSQSNRRLLYEKLLLEADRHGLDQPTRSALGKALQVLKNPAKQPTYDLPRYQPGPHGLKRAYKWPPLQNATGGRAFVQNHRDTLVRFLQDPNVDGGQREKLLNHLAAWDVKLLSRAQLSTILIQGNDWVRRGVLNLYVKRGIVPTEEEVRGYVGSDLLPKYLFQVTQDRRWSHPALLEQIIRSDWGVSVDWIFEAVQAAQLRSAIPRLKELLVENHIYVRRYAAMTLAHLGDVSGLKLLRQEHARYRRQRFSSTVWPDYVATALGKVSRAPQDQVAQHIRGLSSRGRQKEATRALVALGEAAVPELGRTLRGGHGKPHWAAAMVLAQIGPKSVPELREALKVDDPDVRCAAAEALKQIGPPAKDAVPELILALANEKGKEPWKAQAAAIEALGKLGPAAGVAVPALAEILERGLFIDVILAALGDIGPEAKKALPAVVSRLKEKGERWYVGQALVKMGQADAVPHLVKMLKEAEDWKLQWAVLNVIIQIGPHAAKAEPALVEALEYKSHVVRVYAARALFAAEPTNPHSIEVLSDMLASPDQQAADHACRVLIQIGPPAKGAIPALIKALDHEKYYVRQKSALALWKIQPGNKHTVRVLVRLLGHPDKWAVAHAADDLGEVGPGAKEAVPALSQALQHPFDEVRARAAQALGKIGPAAKDAIPALQARLADKRKMVRQAAKESIRRIDPKAKLQPPNNVPRTRGSSREDVF